MQQLYVTFKEETDSQLVDGKYVQRKKAPLGYAAVYNPTSEKCVKKNEAQDEWARYTLNSTGEYEKRFNYRFIWPDGLLYDPWLCHRDGFMKTTQSEYYGARIVPDITQIYDSAPLDEELKPRIIDNIQQSGFKIVDTVTRYSTSNKLWRILDPRGFELEISTANMEEIIMGGVMRYGEIIGDCIWDFGKNGIGKVKLVRII